MSIKVKSQACIIVTELTNNRLLFNSMSMGDEKMQNSKADDESAPKAEQICAGFVEAIRAMYESDMNHPGEPRFKDDDPSPSQPSEASHE